MVGRDVNIVRRPQLDDIYVLTNALTAEQSDKVHSHSIPSFPKCMCTLQSSFNANSSVARHCDVTHSDILSSWMVGREELKLWRIPRGGVPDSSVEAMPGMARAGVLTLGVELRGVRLRGMRAS